MTFNEYGLEERTNQFAIRVRIFISKISKTIASIEDGKQLIRSSGSIGANYIELVEALSKKDSIYRIKICRKEAKESRYWLKLIDVSNQNNLENEKIALIQESHELMNIFGSIVRKNESI